MNTRLQTLDLRSRDRRSKPRKPQYSSIHRGSQARPTGFEPVTFGSVDRGGSAKFGSSKPNSSPQVAKSRQKFRTRRGVARRRSHWRGLGLRTQVRDGRLATHRPLARAAPSGRPTHGRPEAARRLRANRAAPARRRSRCTRCGRAHCAHPTAAGNRGKSSRITWCNGFELVGKVAAQAGLRILTSSLPRVEGKTRVLA